MRKPLYHGWSLTDWQDYYEHNVHINRQQRDIPEITTRCHDTKTGAYNACVMPCQYEFSFMGYAFVSHRNPDPKSYIEAGVQAGDWHVSEIHSGFRVSFGRNRDDARELARKVLIKNAKGLRAAMDRAMQIHGIHHWIMKYYTNVESH